MRNSRRDIRNPQLPEATQVGCRCYDGEGRRSYRPKIDESC